MESITKELEGIKDINCGKQLPPLGLRQQRKVVTIIRTEMGLCGAETQIFEEKMPLG